jgi:membrane-associated phospholipid phosphatase
MTSWKTARRFAAVAAGRSGRLVLIAALLAPLATPARLLAQSADSAPLANQAQTAQAAQGQEKASDTVPPVVHTGWASLAKDTARDFWVFPQRKSTWVLLGAGALAALAVHPADDYVEDHIVGNDTVDKIFKPGRYIGSAPVQIGTAVGLWVVGRYIVAPAADKPQTNKWSHVGFDLLRSQILSQALVHSIKYTARRDRPTGECCAFPSGHAATAFAAASVLERHFGNRGSWPAMVAATYVGASRLVENRHFASDVVFGAALGLASGWTVVGRHGREQFALEPMPVRGGVMIALIRTESRDRGRAQ